VTLKKEPALQRVDRAFETFFIFEGADVNTRLLVWFAGQAVPLMERAILFPFDAPSQKTDAEFATRLSRSAALGNTCASEGPPCAGHFRFLLFRKCLQRRAGGRHHPHHMATTQPVRESSPRGTASSRFRMTARFASCFVRCVGGKETQAMQRDGYVTGHEARTGPQQKVTNLTTIARHLFMQS